MDAQRWGFRPVGRWNRLWERLSSLASQDGPSGGDRGGGRHPSPEFRRKSKFGPSLAVWRQALRPVGGRFSGPAGPNGHGVRTCIARTRRRAYTVYARTTSTRTRPHARCTSTRAVDVAWRAIRESTGGRGVLLVHVPYARACGGRARTVPTMPQIGSGSQFQPWPSYSGCPARSRGLALSALTSLGEEGGGG